MYNIVAAAEGDLERVLEIEREAISPPWTHGALLSELYREDSFFAVHHKRTVVGDHPWFAGY